MVETKPSPTTTATGDGGLATAMADALSLHARAGKIDLASADGVDLVHDLRVALRRCRSLAQGLATVDVVEAKLWRRLSKTARGLFAGLGTMRDAQVMRGWVDELVEEPVRSLILRRFDAEIAAHKDDAADAVKAFDVEAFAALSSDAPARAAIVRRRRPLLLYLAITRLDEARALHVDAMRRRGAEQLHATRIGVKRLRYTLESLLPDIHDAIAKPLKKMQAALGDLHDFDVLSDRLDALFEAGDIYEEGWLQAKAPITAARADRLATYKSIATGSSSSWLKLRRALPTNDLVISRCRRAYILEVAAAVGVDHRHARRAEQVVTALRALDGQTTTREDRLAAVFAAATRRRRAKKATRALLGFTDDEKRQLRVLMEHDRTIQAAGVAAS